MESSLLKRRKLLLLFLLGVGVPSLALSLLAFRGIRNELALHDQRLAESYRALAGDVSDTLTAYLGRAERAFSQLFFGSLGATPPFSRRRLDSLRAHFPLVASAFSLDRNGEVQLLTTDLLFHADGALREAGSPTWTGAASEHFRAGQRHEFQANQYDQALANYRRAYDAVQDSMLKGEALLASVRVQRKAGRYGDALSDCARLVSQFDAVRTSEGMPLGAIALLGHGGLLRATGDSMAALASDAEFYGRLVGGQWELERAQYDFLAEQATQALRVLPITELETHDDSMGHVFRSLASEEDLRRTRTEWLLAFQESAGEGLQARIGQDGSPARNQPQHFALGNGGAPFLVSLWDQTVSGERVFGILLDPDNLNDAILIPALESRIDSASTRWVVRGREGQHLAGSLDPAPSSPTLTATLAGNFPPWLLEFYRRRENPYRRLLASAQGVYLYMFLAIATILAFGLFLTLRAVSHELELARLKSDFVSTVSHEFKSPLTSIRQVAEMLHSGRVPTEDRRRRYYDVLVEQSSRLSSLVTNVLDLARIEEGKRDFRFQPLDLAELARGVVETTRHQVEHQGFDVEDKIPETLPRVRGDPEALRQALSNLLNNAIQYSGEARHVAVRGSTTGEVVTLAVEDSGIGISKADIGRIFDRFFRGGDEVTRSVRGSGLGLTLVKEIVDAHGGTVHVESEVGRGSTFTITLPVLT